MDTRSKISRFAKYTWFVLAYNIVVILWGVFLRASKSGDGCGQHWLTCNGEVVPSAPQLKTIIEFSHRMMSSLDGLVMIVLVVWAYRIWRSSRTYSARSTLRLALASLFFVIVEAAIGAGLVLTGNTAETLTAARPFWMIGHLTNTFILLAFLTLTARRANGGAAINFAIKGKYLLAILGCIGAIIIIGSSGSVAALASMIFPTETLSQGLTADFSPTSNVLLRLRLLHPISSIVTSVLLIFVALWLRRESGDDGKVTSWSNVISILVLCQIAFGAVTLLTLAPILMQLGHLLLADLVWISFVMLTASFLARERDMG